MKPNLWKNAEGDFGMDPNKVLLSTNTAKHFGITPETPFLPNGKEVVGILDICNRDMHYEQYVTAYISYYRPVHKEELYFSFHPGREKEGIAAVEDLLRKRDINVDAGLVRVVNFGDTIANTYEKEQNYLALYTILAIVGFGIAFFGLLTLVSADLQRQRRSLAIRRIFGANYGVCLRTTLRTYMFIVLIGATIGICTGYYLMTLWLQTFSSCITLGWQQPVCIVLGIGILVASMVAWKVRQCFREKPAEVIKA
jgi:ABC-type antimicrobial peptide transport system permease subunit